MSREGTGDLFTNIDSFSTQGVSFSQQKGLGTPLAHRMRPRDLDEYWGQEKVLGEGKPLRQWILSDRVPSLVLWGPPGCGKTTLAHLIAEKTQARFESVSAVLAGVKEIKEAVERAKETRRLMGRRSILFVDEIHRFNKGQQDALLPHVEDGTLTLIGATTENPSFELNSALLSRARVIRLERMSKEGLIRVIRNALQDPERGLGGFLRLSDEAIESLAARSDGDARQALTLLESVASGRVSAGKDALSLEQMEERLEMAAGRPLLKYDSSGEEHYNVVSAFIKSMRDSDPNAALYYLARMLEGGEDPLFIIRRMAIFASEDVGNADPRALPLMMAVKEAVEMIGMPEGRINLAQGVTYLSHAPKSNSSYLGIDAAIEEVRKSGALPVPFHLRNAVTSLMKQEGYGKGYQYPHDRKEPRRADQQDHLPAGVETREFYQPKPSGFEGVWFERARSSPV